jgi:cholesterol oxidase
MRDHYEVVVVGSGYGGGIAAARLAEAGRQVCVLERGRELHPGEYPNTLLTAAREVQARTQRGHHGSPTAMFDFHLGKDMTVLVGCGLGGTSLINANVALEADERIFADKRWPEKLRNKRAELEQYYDKAKRMLGSQCYPAEGPSLAKYAALQRAAEALGSKAEPAPVNVTFKDSTNAAGIQQRGCVLCGDCVTGCNYGAKNTVLMNYLPYAESRGAHIFAEVEARTVLPRAHDKWVVTYRPLGQRREVFAGTTQFVTADVVVLAAGTLGSTGILLRSRAAGLPVSERLGHAFSGNGDVLAFAYDTDSQVRAIGLGSTPPNHDALVGPCISGMIKVTDHGSPRHDLLIQDGVVPGLLGPLLPAAFAAATAASGVDERSVSEWTVRRLRDVAAVALGSRHGPSDRTLTFLVMSDDDSEGRLVLDDDRVHVEWPDVGDRPVFRRDNVNAAKAAMALGGTFVPNPLWTTPFGHSLLTVHPLGGCVMADDAKHGVVNDKGQVFSGGAGTGIHPGLYIADGSIVPRPLDANPSLTISALAERIVALMRSDHGWTGEHRRLPPPAQSISRPGLQLTERMSGFLSTRVVPVTEKGAPARSPATISTASFEAGWADGLADASRIEFVLTICVDDLDATLVDPSRRSGITGTVTAPALHPRRLTVVRGEFQMFDPDLDHVETWYMRYRMTLADEDGGTYEFDSFKVMRERPGYHAWSDTATLYVTVEREGGALALGVMKITPGDFLRQMRTMRVLNVGSARRKLTYRTAFTRMFAGYLLRIYGGTLAESTRFAPVKRSLPGPRTNRGIRLPDAGKREVPLRLPARRDLALSDPEVRWRDRSGHWQKGPDERGRGSCLRLTYYPGGGKGPVMLASGFSMSARSYALDTIDTSLAEHLHKRGWDIFLFDYRASLDLDSSKDEFSIDDIATKDWPAAVAEVLRWSRKESVQVVGHCVGSVSLVMAMLTGMEGVRSAVLAQFPTHPVTSRLNRVKSRLPLTQALDIANVRDLHPDVRRNVPDVFMDVALRAVPMPRRERCGQALCRWVNAIYGCTHLHSQLNQATHEALNEMFGPANIKSLEHLALMMRRGLAVDEDGKDAYLPELPARRKILDVPILFLQGTENYIFRPPGGREMIKWLREGAPNPNLYHLRLLPGYAHLDAIVGRNAARDVYPLISRHLETSARRR